MDNMFYGCKNLISLNLSNFDTSSVTIMSVMFYGCEKLISLDLSNFNTSSVTNMENMFSDCQNLISLDLNNFNTSSVTSMGKMFSGCINLISLDLISFNTSSVTSMDKMFYKCQKLISLDLSNFNTSSVRYMQEMFSGCINLISLDLISFNTSSVFLMHNMFYNCKKLISLDLSNFNVQANTQMNVMFNGTNCNMIICLSNIETNIFTFIKSNYPYLLNNSNCSDICFNKNKKISIENNKCVLECSNDYIYDYKNICYNKCPNGTYNISNNKCISNKEINNIIYYNNYSSSSILSDFNTISSYSIDIYEYSFNEYFIKMIKSNENDNTILNIKKELINGNLDNFILNTILKDNKDLHFKDNNIIYQITSVYNQNNNEYNNISNIYLGKCEKKLIEYYNINNNTILLILKIDYFEEGLLIPIIEYEIYNLITKEKLDINICKYIKIEINIPVNIDEQNIFKYNYSNEYYNDVCYPYTTEKKTDIILKDRRNEYINNNLSVCENNCEYTKYDYDKKKVVCECFIKIKFPIISEIKINKDLLFNNFKDMKNMMNIYIIKCYNTLFTKEGIIKNIGNYIIISIILFIIILCIIFRIKGYKIFKMTLDKIIGNKNGKGKYLNKNKKIKETNFVSNDNSNTKLKMKNKVSIINKNNFLKKGEDILNNKIIFKYTYNDYELNNLNYNQALKLDKRSFIKYYISLLKTKHLIIFTFYTSSDYNSKIIKIVLFLFSFALYLTINTLFFDDATLHKIYEDQGEFNFIYQIPKILYSTIISSMIKVITTYFSLTENKIVEIKNEKNEKTYNEYYFIVKFVIFFILVFLFNILFWYYLSCFCAVYKNTQLHLIKDTLISFGLSLLYPLVLNLLPGILRIPALASQNKKFMYKISQIIQFI